VVEIQKTFYRIPGREILRRWRDAVPEDFVFTVKAWQGITHPAGSPTYRKAGSLPPVDEMPLLGHFRPTEPVFRAWEETREAAAVLGAPLVLLQAPPSFVQTPEHEENLRVFLSGIDRGGSRIALELRAPWNRERLAVLCRRANLIHCVDPFGDEPVSGPPYYLRLHGHPPGNRMYAYRYTKGDLLLLRDRVAGWVAEGEVFCLFNNLSMWEDALAFRDLAESRR